MKLTWGRNGNLFLNFGLDFGYLHQIFFLLIVTDFYSLLMVGCGFDVSLKLQNEAVFLLFDEKK